MLYAIHLAVSRIKTYRQCDTEHDKARSIRNSSTTSVPRLYVLGHFHLKCFDSSDSSSTILQRNFINNVQSLAMAQKFLDGLLKIENTVPKGEYGDERCCICLGDYGMLDSTTGFVELPIRLPGCKHLVGTACITKWFGEHNSCPACRKTFFPAQPRPYLEHGIFDEEEPEVIERVVSFSENPEPRRLLGDRIFSAISAARMERNSREILRIGEPSVEQNITEALKWICTQLELDHSNVLLAQGIMAPLSQRLQDEAHSPYRKAALSIYIVLYLCGNLDEASQFLTNLPCVFVDPDQVRSMWTIIYPHRMELITPEILREVAENSQSGLLNFLPEPEPISADIIHSERSATTESLESSVFDEVERWLSLLLGDEDRYQVIEKLADELYQRMSLEGPPTEEGQLPEIARYSDFEMDAVRVFLACHLMGVAVTYSDTARVHKVSERRVRQLYNYVYFWQEIIICSDIIEVMGPRGVERMLSVLPALTWPPL